jgi:hypothetical protein
MYLIIRERGT